MARTRAAARRSSRRQSSISEYYNAVGPPLENMPTEEFLEADGNGNVVAYQRPATNMTDHNRNRTHITLTRSIKPSNMAKLKRQWDNSQQLARYRNASSAFPRQVGRGDYKTVLSGLAKALQKVGQRTVPKGTFAKIGERLGQAGGGYLSGSSLGAAAGGIAGKAAGSGFSQLVGFGDYSIKANSLMDLPMGQPVAAFGNMSNATIVQHREYIQDIIVPADPAAFSVVKIPLNAGLRSAFPWLSNLAGNYQEYQFIGCIFEFRSLSSESAATLPMGSIVIASNYDTIDPNYADKRHMENSQFCVGGKPSHNLIHPIECDPSVTFVPIKYTRTGGLPDGSDSRLYDHCNVQVATQGLPAGTEGQTIGELWVTYEVALYKPQLGIRAALFDHFYGTTATVGAIATASPFGATASALAPRGGQYGGLGTVLTNVGGVTFPVNTPPGIYIVTITWTGSANFYTSTGATTYSTTQLANYNFFANGAAPYNESTAGAPVTTVTLQWAMQALQPLSAPCTADFTSTMGANASTCEIQVSCLPAGQT